MSGAPHATANADMRTESLPASAPDSTLRSAAPTHDFAEVFRRSPSFLAVLRGPTHVFEMANDAYYQVVGQRALIGRSLLDALPEIEGQGFIEMLDDVLRTGDACVRQEAPVMLARTPSAEAEERFVDFVFSALADENGTRTGVLVHGTDVTVHVRSRKEVDRLLLASRKAREALQRANAELEAQHEELEVANHQLQEGAVEMEAQAEELEVSMQDLAERMEQLDAAARRARFSGDIGEAITGGGELASMMQRCCEATVTHLDAAFARVWILAPSEQMLVLTASAGQYTHLDGPHGRVPIGQFKIGQIAAERRPHLTNAVIGDPRVSEQAWARREGMVAFAGYPLLVGEQLVGVMALFSRREFAEEDFAAFETASTAISVAISNARLLQSERSARAFAEAANRSKTEFLSMMSHELRTPLNAIGGYAELLALGVRGAVTPDQVDYLTRIQRAGRHLQGMISDLLNFTRLEAGHVQFDLRDIDLEQVLIDAEMLVAPQMAERGLTIRREETEHTGPCGSLTVRADDEKLRQVLLNLLTNASKFTPSGGTITMMCDSDAERVYVRVADTGRGIPEDQLARIFEPFVQIDRASTASSQQGIGLGLAISRDLARGMGGELTATSTVGVGSTFTLTVPAA